MSHSTGDAMRSEGNILAGVDLRSPSSIETRVLVTRRWLAEMRRSAELARERGYLDVSIGTETMRVTATQFASSAHLIESRYLPQLAQALAVANLKAAE